MIEARAPGKLFVAGEYAVVEPGGRAVVVAVDRAVTVRLAPAEQHGTVRSARYGELEWRHGDHGVLAEPAGRPTGHVLAAIRAVESLVAELGMAPRHHAMTIDSELDDPGGRKFGLGSSAAVTVAVVRALDAFHGLGLSGLDQYKLAMLATIDVTPAGSGGDVAASSTGGWVGYRSPDRGAVCELRARHGVRAALRAPWPGLEITPLPAPAGLDLVVGWTGEAASTPLLVADVRARRGRPSYERFRTESDRVVGGLTTGLAGGDPAAVLTAVRAARRLLADLGRTLGVAIETPALARLCAAAETVGAAAKSSGAGGGDCGIALVPDGTDLDPMLAAWAEAGIDRLPLTVEARMMD